MVQVHAGNDDGHLTGSLKAEDVSFLQIKKQSCYEICHRGNHHRQDATAVQRAIVAKDVNITEG